MSKKVLSAAVLLLQLLFHLPDNHSDRLHWLLFCCGGVYRATVTYVGYAELHPASISSLYLLLLPGLSSQTVQINVHVVHFGRAAGLVRASDAVSKSTTILSSLKCRAISSL